VPESPKYLYSTGKYEEARKTLKKVAVFNGVGVDLDKNHKYEDFVFDAEQLETVSTMSPHRSHASPSNVSPTHDNRSYNDPFREVEDEIDMMNVNTMMNEINDEQALLSRNRSQGNIAARGGI
jgi:hypothetical protein